MQLPVKVKSKVAHAVARTLAIPRWFLKASESFPDPGVPGFFRRLVTILYSISRPRIKKKQHELTAYQSRANVQLSNNVSARIQRVSAADLSFKLQVRQERGALFAGRARPRLHQIPFSTKK